MARTLDIDGWSRRQHYEFFRGFERPFFTIGADVDVTTVLAASRRPDGPSYFLATAYLALRAVNAVPELRYRIRGESVVEHERVHGGGTVLRPDDTFSFAYFDYHGEFGRFASEAASRIEAVAQGPGGLDDHPERDDLIYLSVIPWISFTSFEHALRLPGDSVPRVVFGGHRRSQGRDLMPVSLAAHHALADGLHAGRFFQVLQAGLEDPGLLATPAD